MTEEFLVDIFLFASYNQNAVILLNIHTFTSEVYCLIEEPVISIDF